MLKLLLWDKPLHDFFCDQIVINGTFGLYIIGWSGKGKINTIFIIHKVITVLKQATTLIIFVANTTIVHIRKLSTVPNYHNHCQSSIFSISDR